MLSKIKSSSSVTETRSSLSHTSSSSDNEEEIDISDTNNNNNTNLNNNQQGKKTQDELLDIVEISRKRRISKDSADSLTSFIRWSFSHIEPSIQRLSEAYSGAKSQEDCLNEAKLDEDIINDDDDVGWPSMAHQHQHFNGAGNGNGAARFQIAGEQLLREHGKLSAGGSSAANLAMLRSGLASERQMSLGSLLSESGKSNKRARTQAYSPESKFSSSNLELGAGHKRSSSYLGNVVERLHHHQLQHQNHHQNQHQHQPMPQQEQQQADVDQESGVSSAGLSYHLQQFLQQQTSLEDLCSSMGLDDSNQIVLAAAIHRALVDSAQPGPAQQCGPADSKSTASSVGSSSAGSGGAGKSGPNNLSSNLTPVSSSHASGANLHLVDSMSRHRRSYNTRGASLHSAVQPTAIRQGSALSLSSRVQQQRHAQAAAALSALASAGSHHPLHLSAGTPTTPIVDFKCDTCPSSFDDRHRLMQHQSIHLELKKDWFTETPVDEVMKIFNRRRGEFLCNICNLRFEATLDYDQHNHSVHGPRPYCCQFCGNGTRTFKCWRQYLNHLYDHRYIFSCTIDDCDFTVNRRDSLRFHIFRFHLNCQLPQNQQQQLRVGHNLMLGAGNNGSDSKWAALDEDEDTENEMNVAD